MFEELEDFSAFFEPDDFEEHGLQKFIVNLQAIRFISHLNKLNSIRSQSLYTVQVHVKLTKILHRELNLPFQQKLSNRLPKQNRKIIANANIDQSLYDFMVDFIRRHVLVHVRNQLFNVFLLASLLQGFQERNIPGLAEGALENIVRKIVFLGFCLLSGFFVEQGDHESVVNKHFWVRDQRINFISFLDDDLDQVPDFRLRNCDF